MELAEVWLFAVGAARRLVRGVKSCRPAARRPLKTGAVLAALPLSAIVAWAQAPEASGEASLKLPDLSQVTFFGVDGHKLLLFGILFCVFGLVFGLMIYQRLKHLPVHRSMREISELIYETCKTYLITQGKFLVLLETFIAVVIVLYFGVLLHMDAFRVFIILLFSILGISGSYSVAWFGIRVNTFANSRTAFASLRGKPYPIYKIPLDAGMSIGMMLISVELLMMLFNLLFIPGDYAGACFIGFAIGESLGAAALRIAGGIFTKIADIGSDLMKIVMRIAMLVASAASYFINGAIARARYLHADHMNFEAPLTSLVWLTSIISITLTYAISAAVIPSLAGDTTQWWKLATIISCGT